MAIDLIKASPVTLKSVGLDEKWLQGQIQLDPSLLGLGELEVAGREHRQPVGGRIDFLMRNVEADTYYEVEVMLGALDESHIIRTIEYWDIERQRRPNFQHRAVIVAEQITTRFFNVVRILYPDSSGTRKTPLRISSATILVVFMIRAGFLDPESRSDLIELGRDGSVAHRLARRANALVLLDDGMSCALVAKVLLLDDDTVRTWYELYQEDGIEGLVSFGHEGGACRLTAEQQDKLKVWIAATLPRTTREVGAWIARECDIEYQTRSGLIALLHRLDMEHRKPKAISRKLDPAKQAAFINGYEALMNRIDADEAVVFADAVHPTHAVRPVGCWGPKDVPIAVEQSSGRDRLNIHGAIDLETGQTVMKDVLTVDALSTIMLLTAIEAMYPGMRCVHVFLDNARYHHAKLVQAWLARSECRIKLHFVPAYCPHLNSIERLWGLMHRHITHNKCYATFREFSTAMLTFLREEVPKNWRDYCDEVTDNFRVITPTEFRIIA